ncbi:MAG: hypothetical protein FWD17_09975, partial [Polyangiaceae bacterium]|nr:hypothetical protein [Polyangiaceae bacterium]
ESVPVGAKRVAIVTGSDRPDFRELGETFARAGLDSRHIHAPEVDGGEAAMSKSRRDAALLGNRGLTAIADVLGGRAQVQ